ncbi:MAG: potassium channel family protein [Homoserinimonas sp.]
MASNQKMTLTRWERASDWPLTCAAVAFLGVYAWSVIGNLQAPDDVVAEAIMGVIWALFAIDYLVSLVLAKPRGRWFVTHLHELAIVLLPMLRPLRLLRLIVLVAVFQRAAGNALRGRVTLYIIAVSLMLIVVAGLGILDVEQNADGSNITNIGDAFWWAFVTITTVGYGDYYPVTVAGRLIAVGLMIAGIALLGSVTATIASWFLEQVKVRDEEAA